MDDLERELRDLSAWLETPDAPDVAARVRARLAAPAPAAAPVALLPGRGARRPARGGAAAGAGRPRRRRGGAAALRRDHHRHVARRRSRPTGSPSPLPSQRPASLDEAQRMVRFPIRLPAKLGPPEQVLVADPDGTGTYRVVTLLYRGGALRIDAFDGRLDPVFQKQAAGPGVEWVQVDGWLRRLDRRPARTGLRGSDGHGPRGDRAARRLDPDLGGGRRELPA